MKKTVIGAFVVLLLCGAYAAEARSTRPFLPLGAVVSREYNPENGEEDGPSSGIYLGGTTNLVLILGGVTLFAWLVLYRMFR